MKTTLVFSLFTLVLFGCDKEKDMSPPPQAPNNLTIAVESSRYLKLNWTDNSVNENAFVVERKNGSTSFASIAILPKNSVAYIDSSVKRDTLYTYRVKAVNLYKLGNYSNEVSGKTELIITGLNFNLIRQGFSLRVVPNKDSTVLMVSLYNNVVKSFDNGTSWQSTAFSPEIVNDYGSGFVDNGTSNGQWIFGTNGGNFVSTSTLGVSFANYGPAGWGCGSFFIQGLSDGKFVASKTGFLRGIYKSSGTDNSVWTNVYPGIDPRGIAVSPSGIYIAAAGNSILKSADLGNNWTSLTINTVANDLGIYNDTLYWSDDISNFYKAPLNNLKSETLVKNFGEAPGSQWPRIGIDLQLKLLYLTSITKGFFISKDLGKTWTNYLLPGVGNYYTASLIKNRIFVCTDAGIFSTDLK